jgi:phage terminase large subunit-like protein
VPACDRFRGAVLEGGITHDDDPVLARHVANAVSKESSSGTVIVKAEHGRKIDAAVAAVIAFERATARAPEVTPFVEVIWG